jgi:hypothetical protein
VRCGLAAADCLAEHWSRTLDGFYRERSGWRATCPLCHTPRALSIQDDRGRVVWNCHHAPACDRDTIRAKLAELLPACLSAGNMRGTHIQAVEALLTDKTLPPNALRVAALLELGWTAERIRDELKMPRSTWADAVRILGQRPRSASAASVRKLGHAHEEPTSENSDSTAGHSAEKRTLEQLDNNCYSDPAGRRRIGVQP